MKNTVTPALEMFCSMREREGERLYKDLSARIEYMKELAKTWDSTTNLVVRISGIEQKILACSGVLDVQNTTLNGGTSNIQLGTYEIPVRGDVVG